MINSQSDIAVFANPKRFLTTTPASRNILRIQPSMIPRMIQQSESDPWTTSGRASHHQTLVGLRPTNQTPQVLLNQGPAPCSHCIIQIPMSASFPLFFSGFHSLNLRYGFRTGVIHVGYYFRRSLHLPLFPRSQQPVPVCTSSGTVLITYPPCSLYILLLCTSLRTPTGTQSCSLAATVLP